MCSTSSCYSCLFWVCVKMVAGFWEGWEFCFRGECKWGCWFHDLDVGEPPLMESKMGIIHGYSVFPSPLFCLLCLLYLDNTNLGGAGCKNIHGSSFVLSWLWYLVIPNFPLPYFRSCFSSVLITFYCHFSWLIDFTNCYFVNNS